MPSNMRKDSGLIFIFCTQHGIRTSVTPLAIVRPHRQAAHMGCTDEISEEDYVADPRCGGDELHIHNPLQRKSSRLYKRDGCCEVKKQHGKNPNRYPALQCLNPNNGQDRSSAIQNPRVTSTIDSWVKGSGTWKRSGCLTQARKHEVLQYPFLHEDHRSNVGRCVGRHTVVLRFFCSLTQNDFLRYVLSTQADLRYEEMCLPAKCVSALRTKKIYTAR